MDPQSAGSGLVPGGGALAVDEVEEGDEQEAANEAKAISPAVAIRFRARSAAISAPVHVFMRRGRDRASSRGSPCGLILSTTRRATLKSF
jgi:hypothetical protein